MTIIDAVAGLTLHAPNVTPRIRRAIWRPGLVVEVNYLQMHLSEPGACRPYVLTIEDLLATDWEVVNVAS